MFLHSLPLLLSLSSLVASIPLRSTDYATRNRSAKSSTFSSASIGGRVVENIVFSSGASRPFTSYVEQPEHTSEPSVIWTVYKPVATEKRSRPLLTPPLPSDFDRIRPITLAARNLNSIDNDVDEATSHMQLGRMHIGLPMPGPWRRWGSIPKHNSKYAFQHSDTRTAFKQTETEKGDPRSHPTSSISSGPPHSIRTSPSKLPVTDEMAPYTVAKDSDAPSTTNAMFEEPPRLVPFPWDLLRRREEQSLEPSATDMVHGPVVTEQGTPVTSTALPITSNPPRDIPSTTDAPVNDASGTVSDSLTDSPPASSMTEASGKVSPSDKGSFPWGPWAGYEKCDELCGDGKRKRSFYEPMITESVASLLRPFRLGPSLPQ